MTKLCKICGKPFIPNTGKQIYCSKECKKIRDARAKRREKRVYPKVCAWCGKKFSAVNFNEKYCSDECRKAKRRKYSHDHYMKNREHHLKQNKEWREANLERKRAYNRQWKKDNPDKVRKHNVKQYWKNRDKRMAAVKQWRKNNPEKYKQYQLNWRKNNPDKMKLMNERNKAHRYAQRHHITVHYCNTHNDCLECPYPYEVCLFDYGKDD